MLPLLPGYSRGLRSWVPAARVPRRRSAKTFLASFRGLGTHVTLRTKIYMRRVSWPSVFWCAGVSPLAAFAAPPGVTIANVCPVSCGVCNPNEMASLSVMQRCVRSPHCYPQFRVCMDGYGGFPDCQHMPVVERPYKGSSKNGLPHGHGQLECALNQMGYNEPGTVNPMELAQSHSCFYEGDFRLGKRHGCDNH